jgi:hypothetical protein
MTLESKVIHAKNRFEKSIKTRKNIVDSGLDSFTKLARLEEIEKKKAVKTK